MRFGKSIIVPAVAVIAAAVALLVSRGVVEALLLIAVVAALTGMYLLRRYARAELLYRRLGGETPGPAGQKAAGQTCRPPANNGAFGGRRRP